MNHEFILLTEEEWKTVINLSEIRENKNKEILLINDDIILYINDSLLWIPQKSEMNNNQQKYGLNYYGITQFDKFGAETLVRVITAWIDLFRNAPPRFNLKGNYSWIDDTEKGSYEKLEIERDNLISRLSTLVLYGHKVVENNYNLLHIGI